MAEVVAARTTRVKALIPEVSCWRPRSCIITLANSAGYPNCGLSFPSAMCCSRRGDFIGPSMRKPTLGVSFRRAHIPNPTPGAASALGLIEEDIHHASSVVGLVRQQCA